MSADRLHVVVVGGGPGALEAVLALRALAGDRLSITLVAREPTFVYRPWSVAEPFGLGRVMRIDLEAVTRDLGVSLHLGTLERVDSDARTLRTSAGELAYDRLVLALGARPAPAVAGALTFRGPRDAERLRVALEARTSGPGPTRIAFVAVPSAFWTLPAYELALMTLTWAAAAGRDVEVALVTGEAAPLEAFGPVASDGVGALLRRRGVELFTSTVPESFQGGRLLVPAAGTIAADTVVALPALVGPSLGDLPFDACGFVPVDDFCRVLDVPDVYAVGDMTDRSLKQGGLAAQQADVAAASIAAGAGATVPVEPYRPVLRAMLLTGEEPCYLRFPPAEDAPRPETSTEAPWWPAHKIVGAHLAPYLATHADFLEVEAAHA